MNVTRIPTPDQGNPLYPLPADYPTLTGGGQRLARVNAARQWILPGTDYQRAEARVASVNFFDLYYLHPDPEAGFDPLFYDSPPLETPWFLLDQLRRWAVWRLNLDIFPRGSAKSTNCRKDMSCVLITRPAFSFVYATSTHDNAKYTGQVMRDTCYENQRVHDDFAPEYDGRLKPVRGESPTGIEFFYLNNGSWLRCISAESRQRGLRPRRYRLDDPEYDAKASTSMSVRRDYMSELVFKVVLPMVMRGECGADWTNTFVSKRHYGYHAMQVQETESGAVALDPRFNFWNRTLVRAAYEETQPDGTIRIRSCWPSMWPATRAEKESNPALATRMSLEEIKEVIGTASFNSEYMGNPGSTGDSYFPEPELKKHGWSIEDPDEKLETDPRHSNSKMVFYRKGEKVSLTFLEFLQKVRLFITADTSYTQNTSSDYKVACCMGIDLTTNELFVLDLWSAQCGEPQLVQQILKMADRWKVPTIHPELVRESISLYEALVSMVQTKATQELGYAHTPSIMKDNRPGGDAKEAKIAALLFRFEHGLIKFPLWKGEPWWTRLFDQISEYNPELEGGGVPHDDELDTVSMSRKIIRGRLRDNPAPPPVNKTFLERRLEGETMVGGIPIGFGVDFSKVTPDQMDQLLAQELPDDPDRTRTSRA